MTAGIEFDPAERDAIAAEMNISVLKRSDTAIKCVLKSANHVCLYQLEDDQQWRRMEVEGSLFIVERYLDHRNNPKRHMHRIVIINRKSLNNYTDDIIVGNKHLELNDQMIMYSNSKQATIGMWFYQKAQAHQIFDLLQRIVNGEKPQPTPDPPRQRRTPKRPARPPQPSQKDTPEKTETSGDSAPDNSLERFFPNLKLTNGVAGHQVPEAAKDSMFESQAVSTMSKSPGTSKTATAFKPTAEIDAAIITASECGMPEGAVPGATATDVTTLASQAMQVVKGKPKLEQKRQPGARPRHSPKPVPPQTSSQASVSPSAQKPNGVAKTTSPARQSMPGQAKASLATKSSANARSNLMAKLHRASIKASPPAKRTPGGRRGQAPRTSISGKHQSSDKPSTTSATTSTSSATLVEKADSKTGAKSVPLIQLLSKPKLASEFKAAGISDQDGKCSPRQETAQAAPSLAIPATTTSSSRTTKIAMSGDAKHQPPISSPEPVRPGTPNAPISKEVPGAPRAKQSKTPIGGTHALQASNASIPPIPDDQKAGVRQRSMNLPLAEEEARRQLHNMSMRQAHAENLKMQEAHMFAMQPPFPFVSTELGIGQQPSMLGGGLAGPGAAPAPFPPSLHPQMAMMMQRQQHQMFMQQQFLAQQQQRQMQMQAGHAHGITEPGGSGAASEIAGSIPQGGQAKTKEESANDLMRMLNVDRSERKKALHKIDEKKSAKDVGMSISEAEKDGELGTGGDKLNKGAFRAVVQRMLTDRRLFDSVYKHYLRSRDE